MKYYIKKSSGVICELSKSDGNYTGATDEISREEYDGIMLGIRVFSGNEEPEKVISELSEDGYYEA